MVLFSNRVKIIVYRHFQSSNSNYLQTFLEECRCKVNEKESKSFVAGDLESSSDDDTERQEEKEEDFEGNSD